MTVDDIFLGNGNLFARPQTGLEHLATDPMVLRSSPATKHNAQCYVGEPSQTSWFYFCGCLHFYVINKKYSTNNLQTHKKVHAAPGLRCRL